ncbi:hypothetical protein EJ08DRAFT_738189 [Tothia fuscella]|uniref:Uncharacterized protein n=1 Tax=Tothia fuscella TaxID=1048955 RepID=A0A9P4NH42_9PEZI|nr:hypothetical protein EJ08DRAFT_738189 [Tothia fuscella]
MPNSLMPDPNDTTIWIFCVIFAIVFYLPPLLLAGNTHPGGRTAPKSPPTNTNSKVPRGVGASPTRARPNAPRTAPRVTPPRPQPSVPKSVPTVSPSKTQPRVPRSSSSIPPTKTQPSVSRRAPPLSPTVSAVVAWLKTTVWDGKNAVFYTRPIDHSGVDRYTEASGGQSFRDIFVNDDLEEEWRKDCDKVGDDYIAVMSEAFARCTRGEATLLMGKGKQPEMDSYWKNHEAPFLKANGIVVKAVDLSTGEVWDKNILKV